MQTFPRLALFFRLFRVAITDWARPSRNTLPSAFILTIANDADRPLISNGKYFSPNIDLLSLSCNKSIVSISRLLDSKVGTLSLVPTYRFSGMFARALIRKHLKRAWSLLVYRPSIYCLCYSEIAIWRLIISTVNPKLVLAIMPSRELCKVCNERSIPCFDVQHGVIFPSHAWYAIHRLSEPKDWLPSGWVLWDQYARSVVSLLSPVNTFTVGCIAQRTLEESNWVSVQISEEHINYISKLDADTRPKILVTLSWGMREILNADPIHDSLVKAAKITSDEYIWLFRLHPAQTAGHRYFESAQISRRYSNVLPIGSLSDHVNAIPLSLLASHIDLHITECSSTVLDLSLCSIRSIVINSYPLDRAIYNPSLWDTHINYLPDPTSEELVSAIKHELSAIDLHSECHAEKLRYQEEYRKFLDFASSL
jgi:hypothetical protein